MTTANPVMPMQQQQTRLLLTLAGCALQWSQSHSLCAPAASSASAHTACAFTPAIQVPRHLHHLLLLLLLLLLSLQLNLLLSPPAALELWLTCLIHAHCV
jgi:hypothetical protein